MALFRFRLLHILVLVATYFGANTIGCTALSDTIREAQIKSTVSCHFEHQFHHRWDVYCTPHHRNSRAPTKFTISVSFAAVFGVPGSRGRPFLSPIQDITCFQNRLDEPFAKLV